MIDGRQYRQIKASGNAADRPVVQGHAAFRCFRGGRSQGVSTARRDAAVGSRCSTVWTPPAKNVAVQTQIEIRDRYGSSRHQAALETAEGRRDHVLANNFLGDAACAVRPCRVAQAWADDAV